MDGNTSNNPKRTYRSIESIEDKYNERKENSLTKPVPVKSYSQLVKAIQTTIATARAAIQKTQAETYWQVGRFIFDYVLNGADRAKYGEHIFEHLEKDLKIEAKTLRDTVRLAREFPIWNARSKLTWSVPSMNRDQEMKVLCTS